MKTLLTKQQKLDKISELGINSTLSFYFSRSGVCTLKNMRGDSMGFRAGGGGYDKRGSVLAGFIKLHFEEELKRLPTNYGSGDSKKGFYGLRFFNTKTNKSQHRYSKNCRVGLDGACGMSSMERILEKIGFKLVFVMEDKNQDVYKLEPCRLDEYGYARTIG